MTDDLGGNSGSREPSRVSPSRPDGFDPGREAEVERVARALYQADCALDPIEPREPEWGRGGYKTQTALWQGLAHAAIAALRSADEEASNG